MQNGRVHAAIAASFNSERDAWGNYPKLADGSLNRDLRLQMQSQDKYLSHVSQEMTQSQRERDAVLTTMKLLNGQQLQPAGYNASRPLPMMALGLSNKDRG